MRGTQPQINEAALSRANKRTQKVGKRNKYNPTINSSKIRLLGGKGTHIGSFPERPTDVDEYECPKCDGLGTIGDLDDIEMCPECAGLGVVNERTN